MYATRCCNATHVVVCVESLAEIVMACNWGQTCRDEYVGCQEDATYVPEGMAEETKWIIVAVLVGVFVLAVFLLIMFVLAWRCAHQLCLWYRPLRERFGLVTDEDHRREIQRLEQMIRDGREELEETRRYNIDLRSALPFGRSAVVVPVRDTTLSGGDGE